MQDDFKFRGRFQFNDESLRRHGVSRDEAIEVVESDYSEWVALADRGNNKRFMFVGFSSTNICLLEVGVESLPDSVRNIFHANKARKYFVNIYNKNKGYEKK